MTRIARRTVRTAHGTDHVPAVTLLTVTLPRAACCAGCLATIPAGTSHVVARRDGDAAGAFDVRYHSLECRASVVS